MSVAQCFGELCTLKVHIMSDANEMENTEKRTVKLTAKALACKMETLQKQRQSNVTKMKALSREIKELMKNDKCKESAIQTE